jgi:Insertion element 4 transposase N-terminal/Transposase DDE domain
VLGTTLAVVREPRIVFSSHGFYGKAVKFAVGVWRQGFRPARSGVVRGQRNSGRNDLSAKTSRACGVPLPGQSSITRTVKVAEGVFAPGHLGELTRIVPFEMVDAVLAETGATQVRVRKLPARVVVYLLLAAGLFEQTGHLGVWRKLTGGLDGLPVASVTGSGLWQARARLGIGPVRALFDLLRGPATTGATGAARWCGLLVTAIDGTTFDVPDTASNLYRLGRQRCRHGAAGYPQIRLVTLVACGTRAVIDAVFGPKAVGESVAGLQLARSLRAGMIVLLDRGLTGNAFFAAVAATGAEVLGRLSSVRRPPVLRRFADGSYLSVIGGVPVRIVECEITIATSAGRRSGLYRLATTLTDPDRHPAFALVKLYHERWEVESAYFEIKKTMLGRRVLRAATPAGIAQEIYALLVTYQAIRIAIADATGAAGGIDPDRASFSVALEAARDQVVRAAAVIADTSIDLVGTIGRHVLDNLMPDRRPRVSPRAVKRPLSRYAYKSLNIDRRTYKATLTIDIIAPPARSTTGPEP